MADLFTLEELASYLQTDLDTGSATIARASATALIEAYTRRSFTDQVEVIEAKRVRGGRVTLREPVVEVASVEAIDGATRLPTLWTFDGIRTVYVGGATAIINYPEGTSFGTVEVTYTHGYTAAPADVKAVGLAVAGRAYSNPAGIRSETIGAYSYTLAGADDDVAGSGLLAAERTVLNRYLVQSRTVVLAP